MCASCSQFRAANKGAQVARRARNVRAQSAKGLSFLFNLDGVDQGGDYAFRKAAGHPENGRVFFVEKVARIVSKFILAAEYKVLVIIKHSVFGLIPYRHSGGNSDFENPRPAFVVQQHAAKVETSDDTFNHRV